MSTTGEQVFAIDGWNGKKSASYTLLPAAWPVAHPVVQAQHLVSSVGHDLSEVYVSLRDQFLAASLRICSFERSVSNNRLCDGIVS